MEFETLTCLSRITIGSENWLWPVCLFGLGAIVFLTLTYLNSPLRGGVKWLAVGLKAIGLLLLVSSLLEPVWVEEVPKKGGNDLVILADNSQGLGLIHPETKKSLGAAMQEVLQGDSTDILPDWMAKLGDTFRLQNYTFDRKLERTSHFSEIDFSGNASSVLSSLKNIQTRYARRAHAATVIFTDGNATDSEALEEILNKLTSTSVESSKSIVPIFPVLVGSDLDGGVDLALDTVSVSQSAFEDAPVTITVSAKAMGEVGSCEVFALNHEGKEVHAEPIAFATNAGEQGWATAQVRLRIGSAPEGLSFFQIGIRQAKEVENPIQELTTKNNQQTVAVDRGRGPYRILYVSGRPNWEYKFIRRAVSEDSEIDLVGLIRIAKREPKFEWRGRTGETSNPLFRGFNSEIPEETQQYDQPVLIRLNTKDREELREGFPKAAENLFLSYRAIILDDVEAEFFTQEQQVLLDRFVSQRGGTLVMLGGQESFQTGKWNNTAIGRMLPIYLDQIRQRGPALNATYNLSREGWLEPWVRLRNNQQDEETRLAYMPAFFSIHRTSAIKPGASVLATVTDGENQVLPALITQRYGEGKTAALTVADMWRWGMKDRELQDDLAKSWRQLLRWCVAEVPGRVTLEHRFENDGTLPSTHFSARVRDTHFRPQDDASVRFTLQKEIMRADESDSAPQADKKEMPSEPSLEEAGVFTAQHYSEEEGGFRLQATTRNGRGEIINESETGWALNPAAKEFRSLGPNRDLLEKIATASGGKVFQISQIDELVNTLTKLRTPIVELKQKPLWHLPWYFLLALLCFVGEWALRRWKGVL